MGADNINYFRHWTTGSTGLIPKGREMYGEPTVAMAFSLQTKQNKTKNFQKSALRVLLSLC